MARYTSRALVKQHNETAGADKIGDIEIAVIEKGATIGAHILSGAVMDPRALRELIPDFEEQGAPLESPVKEDFFSISRRSMRFTHDNSAATEEPRLLHRFAKSSDRLAGREM